MRPFFVFRQIVVFIAGGIRNTVASPCQPQATLVVVQALIVCALFHHRNYSHCLLRVRRWFLTPLSEQAKCSVFSLVVNVFYAANRLQRVSNANPEQVTLIKFVFSVFDFVRSSLLLNFCFGFALPMYYR